MKDAINGANHRARADSIERARIVSGGLLLQRRQRQQFGQFDVLAIRFGRGKGRRWTHRGEASPRELLIASRPFDLPSELGVRQLANDSRRNAGDERARRHDHPRLHECHRGNECGFTDRRVIVDDGIHADERIALHDAAMQHGAMTNVSFFLDDGADPRESMQYASILDIGALAQFDMAEIAAQARARTDVASGANNDIADQDGGGMNKCLTIDDWRDAVDRINSEVHVTTLSLIARCYRSDADSSV
jgi:hypothetical protein